MTAPNSSEGTEQPTTSSYKAADIALSDPLRAETRKARLYLLGVSMVGTAIVVTGLVPAEITTLGITFEQSDRQGLLGILALVTLYFLVTFVTYGVSDFLFWQQAYRNARSVEVLQTVMEAEKEVAVQVAALEQAEDEFQREIKRARDDRDEAIRAFLKPDQRVIVWYPALSSVVSPVRAVVEFLLPVLVGLCAIYLLVRPTALQAIIAGVAAVVAILSTVLAVRRSRHAPVRAASKVASKVASEATSEAATRSAAEEKARKEPPQQQSRDG